MYSNFKNILIPVDFSINTALSVNKAREIIVQNRSVIHLMHVIRPAYPLGIDPNYILSGFSFIVRKKMALLKLMDWQKIIEEQIPTSRVEILLTEGTVVESQIRFYAQSIKPQLIIIGKHHYHNWFPVLNTVKPNRLAAETNCPVLSIKTGGLFNSIKPIVFPICNVVPKGKLEILIALANVYHANMHLVMLLNDSLIEKKIPYELFIEPYRLLRKGYNGSVVYKVLTGSNLAKATLVFATEIRAGLIIVQTPEETLASSLNQFQITDLVKGNSKIEILTMESID